MLEADIEQITVVVVTYNSGHCVPQMAQALKDFPRVFVVDNASQDDTLKAVQKHLPHAIVLAQECNLGFGCANNLALRQVQTSHALIVNPDCFVDPIAASALMRVSCDCPEAAIVAPQIVRKNGQLEISYRASVLQWASRGPAAEGLCCVGFVSGAAMLLRLSLFPAQTFFDERFFLYYEDEDLCLSVLKRSNAIVVAPHVKVLHLSRGSVKGNTPLRHEYFRGYHHVQSKLIFSSKHQSIQVARAKRRRLMWLSFLGLPLRLMVPLPRHVARYFGRLAGLLAQKSY